MVPAGSEYATNCEISAMLRSIPLYSLWRYRLSLSLCGPPAGSIAAAAAASVCVRARAEFIAAR